MQISKNQGFSDVPPSINKSDPPKLPAEQKINEKNNGFKEDQTNLKSKTGHAVPSVSILTVEDGDKGDPIIKSEAEKNPPKLKNSNNFKLKSADIKASIFNDSNMFVKNEDDLGMTTSYNAHANFSFLDNKNTKTNIFLNNSSSLHTQFLSKENDITKQSLITTNDFEVGINNNGLLSKNSNFSVGAKIQYKGINTDTNSNWANVQKSLHNMANLRQYDNQENPFVSNEAYITPMLTLDYEKEKISSNKLYLKTEAKAAVGAMIPMKNSSQFYTPIRGDLYGGVKFGYSHNNLPLIYLKADGNISNEPLTYNRDNGTIGTVGLAIGNEISLMKKEKVNVSLMLESKIIKPFGNLPGNPLPDQTGKHDIIHEMFNVGLKFNFK